MSPKILLLEEIDLPEASRERLEGVGTVAVAVGLTQDELPGAVGDAAAIMFQLATLRITAEVLDAATELRVIGRIGIGTDQVDVVAANARDVTVVNAAGAQAEAVADHAFALMLSLARNLVRGDTAVRTGRWEPPWTFMGRGLAGKSLGIVGFGAIGRQLAQRALSFGMTVVAYDPYVSESDVAGAGAKLSDLPELLAHSDYVSIHVPLTETTHHLIGADELDLMGSGAYLVNTSRGPVVDEEALVAALVDDRLAGAGLDVFESEPLDPQSPLVGMDNVVLTPHIGGWTFGAQARTQSSVVEDVARILEGSEPINPVRI